MERDGTTVQPESKISEAERLELEQKLSELEKKNEDTWQQRLRERERLTQELEAERQANLGRALGDIIADVKTRKAQTLQEIKSQQQRKASLGQQLKQLKKDLESSKAAVKRMAADFERLQKEREAVLEGGLPGADELAEDLASRLVAIEEADAAQKQVCDVFYSSWRADSGTGVDRGSEQGNIAPAVPAKMQNEVRERTPTVQPATCPGEAEVENDHCGHSRDGSADLGFEGGVGCVFCAPAG